MKRGFTLIELLAVIIILAIIALIAVPIVINIINESKKSSEERSIDLYVDSVENTIINENLKRKYEPNACEIQKDGNLKCTNTINNYNEDEVLKININGIKPSGGTVVFEKGKITSIFNLILNGKKYDYSTTTKDKLLEIPENPGLYDENYKLLASWDELVNAYNLNIYKDYTNIIYKSSAYKKVGSGSMYDILNNNDKLSAGKLLIIGESEENKRIGNYAFADCTTLTKIIISNTMTSIGDYSFKQCSGLVGIQISSNITNIGIDSFMGCSNLESIKVDSENPKYEDANSNVLMDKSTNNLILGCKNSIIPYGVTEIGKYAFYGCSGLTSLQIPSSVINIGEYAFRGCSNLESIKVDSENSKYDDGNSNVLINKSTNKLMLGCRNSIIPYGVTEIGNYAFYGSGITNIIIPSSVTKINEYAFYGCSRLSNITIPNSVTEIGKYAFYGCSGLTSLQIPSSVINIGEYAFYGCNSLESIEVDSENLKYEDGNSNVLINKSTNYLILGCKNSIIPNTVTHIGEYAFEGCKGFTSITIPDSVTMISNRAFADTDLNNVILGNNIIEIYGGAFANTALTNVILPSSIVKIHGNIFSNCTDLRSVTFENTTGWKTKSCAVLLSSGETMISNKVTPINVTNSQANVNLLNTYSNCSFERSN